MLYYLLHCTDKDKTFSEIVSKTMLLHLIHFTDKEKVLVKL